MTPIGCNSSELRTGPSETEIRKRLTLEEEKDKRSFTTVNSDSHFTETKYLLSALDLEEQQ